MEGLVEWYQTSLGQFMSEEMFIFLVSMLPLVELRGGLIVASLLGVPIVKASIICVIANLVPIPFILLFIKKIFAFMKKHNILTGVVSKLEQHAEKKSKGVEKGEFIFLLLFVGIPIPGTGAWTGSLIAALMDFDLKKAVAAILGGLAIAVFIMDVISYGVLGSII